MTDDRTGQTVVAPPPPETAAVPSIPGRASDRKVLLIGVDGLVWATVSAAQTSALHRLISPTALDHPGVVPDAAGCLDGRSLLAAGPDAAWSQPVSAQLQSRAEDRSAHGGRRSNGGFDRGKCRCPV
jgi:hypothetical protein